jgi:hypothetical protein
MFEYLMDDIQQIVGTKLCKRLKDAVTAWLLWQCDRSQSKPLCYILWAFGPFNQYIPFNNVLTSVPLTFIQAFLVCSPPAFVTRVRVKRRR